jgi:hypothetical protein
MPAFGTDVFITVATLVTWKTRSSFFLQHSDWEPCPLKIRKVKLIDGSWNRRGLMRRKVNGRWEYRKMTSQEAAQTMDLRASPRTIANPLIQVAGGFFAQEHRHCLTN